MSNNDNGGVISFIDIKKKALEKSQETVENTLSNDDMLEDGLAAFNDALAMGAQGFISVVFDESENPIVVVAGEIEPFKAMGVLDLCKAELMSAMVYGNMQGNDIEFIDDDSELD